jgi:hypothetical protein
MSKEYDGLPMICVIVANCEDFHILLETTVGPNVSNEPFFIGMQAI